jgi:hypothetical protein
MILFNRALLEDKKKGIFQYLYYIYSGIGVFGSLWLNPGAIIPVGSMLLVGFIYVVFNRNFLRTAGFIICLLFSILSVILLWKVQGSVFPWIAFRDWERFVQYPVNALIYLKILGSVGILGVIGIFGAVRKRDFLWYTVTAWFLAPFVGLSLLTGILPVSNGRFIQSAGYIPAAILAVPVIWQTGRLAGKHKNVLRTALMILIILSSLPGFVSSINRQLTYVHQNMTNPLVMLRKDNWEAMNYLGSRDDGTIIAPSDISTMIPAFSGFRTLVGHPTFTYLVNDKYRDLDQFYWSGDITVMKNILDKYKVTAVWVPEWMGNKENLLSLGFHRSFQSGKTEVYEK